MHQMKNEKTSGRINRLQWQESEFDINSLLASPFDFIIVLDHEGHIHSAGENCGERFHLNYDELLGECIWNLLPEEVIPHRKSFLADVFRTGRAVRFQDEKRGQWNDIIIVPIFNRQGQTTKAAVLAYDITSRMVAEQKMKLLSRFPDENPSPVLRVDKEGVIVYANQASAPLLEKWSCSIGEQLPEKINRFITYTIRSGEILDIEEQCGSQVLSLQLTPLTDSEFLNIYGRDITESKISTDALMESEERFRNLGETSHDLIWHCDQNGCFTYLNPAWEKILGYTPAEMLGHHFGEFKPDGITDADRNIFESALAGTEIFGNEATYISKSGKLVNIVFNVRKLMDSEGKTIGIQGSAHDITERKRAEKKLSQNEAHYRNLFMNNPAAILETDLTGIGAWLQELQETGIEDLGAILNEKPDTLLHAVNLIRIVDINTSADRMLKLKKDTKFADIAPKILGKNSYALLKGLLLAIWAGKNQFKMEGEGTTIEGHPLAFILQWNSPQQDNGPDLSCGVITLTDVTKTRILKKRLMQSEKMATLGLLVSGISHEINNPNNFIMFNLPILRDYLQTLLPIIDDYSAGEKNFELFGMKYPVFRKDIMDLLDNMEHGTNRINNTVARLREFFAPRDHEQLCWSDIGAVIQNSVTLCQSQIKKTVQKIEVAIPEEFPEFYTDPHALEHIIINLLINGAYAADKENSWIKLTVGRGKSWEESLVIEVQDNGRGMDEASLKKIFEPFYTTKSADSNSGLGMFICYNLIEGLGGRIEVKSKPRAGSTFRILLPEIKP